MQQNDTMCLLQAVSQQQAGSSRQAGSSQGLALSRLAGAHLAKVELEAGAVLAHLCLHALLPRQQLHGEHAELILDAGQLQG